MPSIFAEVVAEVHSVSTCVVYNSDVCVSAPQQAALPRVEDDLLRNSSVVSSSAVPSGPAAVVTPESESLPFVFSSAPTFCYR